MLRKGGYKIIDFAGVALSGTAVTFPVKLYTRLKENADKPVLCTGLNVGSALLQDIFVQPVLNGTDILFTAGGYTVTVKNTGAVTAAEGIIGGGSGEDSKGYSYTALTLDIDFTGKELPTEAGTVIEASVKACTKSVAGDIFNAEVPTGLNPTGAVVPTSCIFNLKDYTTPESPVQIASISYTAKAEAWTLGGFVSLISLKGGSHLIQVVDTSGSTPVVRFYLMEANVDFDPTTKELSTNMMATNKIHITYIGAIS